MIEFESGGAAQLFEDTMKVHVSQVPGLGEVGVDPLLHYGADASGARDATGAFQRSWSDAVSEGHNVLLVSPGTYTVSDCLHGAATALPVRLVARVPGTVVIQRTTAVPFVQVLGSRTATVPLATDVAAGAMSLSLGALPTGGLNPDDHVELSSNVLFASGSGHSAATYAEIAQVQSVTGAGPFTVNLYGPLEEAYATANAAALSRVDYAGDGSLIDGVTFRQTAQNRDTADAPLVRFALVKNPLVQRSVFRDADVPGVEFRGVLDGDVDRCRFANLTDNLGSNFIGYGVNVAGNCRGVRVLSPRGRWVRHVVTTSFGTFTGPASAQDVGVPRHTLVAGGQASGTSAGAWNTHKEGKFFTFQNCESYGDKNYGFYVRCQHVSVIDPVVVNPAAALPCVKFAETEAVDGILSGGRLLIGPAGKYGVQSDSPRTSVLSPHIYGPGSAGENIRFETTATDTRIVMPVSKDVSGFNHISHSGSGTNHVLFGGVFDNTSGSKRAWGGAAAAQGRVVGRPVGTNLTPIDNNNNALLELLAAARTVSANATLTSDDRVVLVDCTGGARTVTLPTINTGMVDREYIIVKKDSSANAVTIAGTVNGTVNPTLAAQFNVMRIVCDGAAYFQF